MPPDPPPGNPPLGNPSSGEPPPLSAADRWRAELAGWAIPDEILARAPEPPWGFPVELFRVSDTDDRLADSPSHRRARESLPDNGSVLDVGCGGGAGSIALAPPAALVVGVDSTPAMLAEFAAAMDARGVVHREVEGAWPDALAATLAALADGRAGAHPAGHAAGRAAASAVPTSPTAGDEDRFDVVVCHHVLYNVPDLDAFARALTTAARNRVVCEITATHPLTGTRELWRHFHGIDRPTGPTAALAADVLRAAGVDVHLESSVRPVRSAPREAVVRLNRRRLCLPADRESEVDALLGDLTGTREIVTLWWDAPA